MGEVGKFELGFKLIVGVQSLAVVAGGFAVDIRCFEVLQPFSFAGCCFIVELLCMMSDSSEWSFSRKKLSLSYLNEAMEKKIPPSLLGFT